MNSTLRKITYCSIAGRTARRQATIESSNIYIKEEGRPIGPHNDVTMPHHDAPYAKAIVHIRPTLLTAVYSFPELIFPVDQEPQILLYNTTTK